MQLRSSIAYVAHGDLQQREDHAEGRDRALSVLDPAFMLVQPFFQRGKPSRLPCAHQRRHLVLEHSHFALDQREIGKHSSLEIIHMSASLSHRHDSKEYVAVTVTKER